MESRLSIGTVLSNTFSTIGNNPLATLGVSFLIGVLPTQIFSFALLGSTVVNRTQLFTTPGGIGLYCAFLLVSVFFSMLVQATLVRVTVAHAREEKVSIGASIAAALGKVLPLLGLTIVMTIALAFGMILLIVPGVILYIMWCVASPALVAEDIGIFEAFGRSRELTKGSRWKIFGMFLMIAVLLWACLAVLGVIAFTTGIVTSAVQGLTAGVIPIWYTLFNVVTNTVIIAISSALVATLYVQLRIVKEGPAIDALADVFA